MKKIVCCLLVVMLVASILAGACAPAPEKPIKLHFASWNVPADPTTKILEQIAADLEEATGGMVTAEISFQALGKPSDYYDAIVDRLCDIGYVALNFLPGRFPLTEMLVLPIAYPDNVIRGKAAYEMWRRGYYDEQFADVKVVALGSNVDFLFMWRDEPVTTLSGIKGKKLSTSNRVHSDMMKAIDAVPVQMPVTELYVSLETGVLDGAFQGWPFIPVFKGHEVVKYATLPSRSAAPALIAMNKDTYKNLPKEAQALIDNSVEKYSLAHSQGFQQFDGIGKKIFLDAGGTIDTLSAADTAEMDRLFKPIFDKWLSDAKERGLLAEEALDELYSVLVELGMKEPFAR